MVKIRIGTKPLVEFNDLNGAFDWVRKSAPLTEDGECVFSVLTYERGELLAMDRYYYDGSRITKENILS